MDPYSVPSGTVCLKNLFRGVNEIYTHFPPTEPASLCFQLKGIQIGRKNHVQLQDLLVFTQAGYP